MKKIFACIVILITTISACNHFHTSDNGLLDGFWQLTQADTLQSGVSADVKDKRIFWTVQFNLLEVRNYVPDGPTNILFRFEHQGDSLIVYNPVADQQAVQDSIVTDLRTIEYYGLYNLREKLLILQLSSSKMILQNERLRMHFRKY